jgi:hypothetical protein
MSREQKLEAALVRADRLLDAIVAQTVGQFAPGAYSDFFVDLNEHYCDLAPLGVSPDRVECFPKRAS